MLEGYKADEGVRPDKEDVRAGEEEEEVLGDGKGKGKEAPGKGGDCRHK